MKAIGRIFQFIDFKQISVSKFERNNLLSNGYLAKMRHRNANVGEEVLAKILDNYPELSADWLIIGKGLMIIPKELPPPNFTKMQNRTHGFVRFAK